MVIVSVVWTTSSERGLVHTMAYDYHGYDWWQWLISLRLFSTIFSGTHVLRCAPTQSSSTAFATVARELLLLQRVEATRRGEFWHAWILTCWLGRLGNMSFPSKTWNTSVLSNQIFQTPNLCKGAQHFCSSENLNHNEIEPLPFQVNIGLMTGPHCALSLPQRNPFDHLESVKSTSV